jgi:hypothetical protein
MCGNLEVPIGFPKFAMEFPRGREAISWDNIQVFRYVDTQSMAKIFLALDHTGDVHKMPHVTQRYLGVLGQKPGVFQTQPVTTCCDLPVLHL